MTESTAHQGGPATLGDLGEFGLIEAITADLVATPAVLLGPGDDAAVVDLAGPAVTTVDVLVEGVHFRRDWVPAADVGRKALAVNVADLEAMGARAVAVVVGFSAPPGLPVQWALDFAAGLAGEAGRAGAALVGGDVTRSEQVTVAVTALGSLDGRAPVRRAGASPGGVVALLGRTGWAAAGWRVLSRGFRSPRAVVDAYRVPEVAYGAGRLAAEAGATAMVDVSDGLLADLGHVAAASGVVVDLDAAAFDLPDPLVAVAAATGGDPLTLVLTGGEDHALAAVFPDTGELPPGWRPVGRTRAPAPGEPPGVLVDGRVFAATAGWDHFPAASGPSGRPGGGGRV